MDAYYNAVRKSGTRKAILNAMKKQVESGKMDKEQYNRFKKIYLRS